MHTMNNIVRERASERLINLPAMVAVTNSQLAHFISANLLRKSRKHICKCEGSKTPTLSIHSCERASADRNHCLFFSPSLLLFQCRLIEINWKQPKTTKKLNELWRSASVYERETNEKGIKPSAYFWTRGASLRRHFIERHRDIATDNNKDIHADEIVNKWWITKFYALRNHRIIRIRGNFVAHNYREWPYQPHVIISPFPYNMTTQLFCVTCSIYISKFYARQLIDLWIELKVDKRATRRRRGEMKSENNAS